MQCFVDIPGRPLFLRESEEEWVWMRVQGKGIAGRVERGNCSQDAIYERRLKQIAKNIRNLT